MAKRKLKILSAACAFCVSLSGYSSAALSDEGAEKKFKKKNIILMITDGASDGTWDIASFWQHGKLLNETYPYQALDTRYALATYALNDNKVPTLSKNCDPDSYAKGFGYFPSQVNDSQKGILLPFASYEYLNRRYTDSAASATAFATGKSTYNGAISLNNCGEELTLITELAKAKKMATGVVSSVPFSHATPAVFGAKNSSRKNGAKIGSDMLTNGHLDLIMGAGHPLYDADGKKQRAKYNYINKASWQALQQGKLYPIGSDKAWHFIETKADFERLADSHQNNDLLASPLVGIVQNNATLQQSRSACKGEQNKIAFGCDFLASSPNLATMSLGALNYLAQNNNGFFVMIEGGAVDWAAHANDTARLIEEQLDFNHAVSKVYDWVEKNSNWNESLLIVTSDHGNAFVLGADANEKRYQAVPVLEPKTMPKVKYYSRKHTNELVRLYAKGAGSENFGNYVIGKDEGYASRYRHHGANGDYLQNKDVFNVIKDLLEK